MFQVLRTKISKYDKLKEGIFDGPQFRQLLKDEKFVTIMSQTEEDA